MRSFDRGNRAGGRRSFGDRRSSFSGGRGGERTMYKTTCSNCGKDCEVPFRPSGRPVFCSDCFREKGGDEGRQSFSRPRFGNRDHSSHSSGPGNDVQFEKLNRKIDKILALLTTVAPSEAEPELVEKLSKENETLNTEV